jgi:hypothetical protein
MPVDKRFMQDAKIQLSADELELMQNSEVILTKNSILDKISSGLQQLGNRLSMELMQFSGVLPAEIFSHGFKVSRGEKYKGLPYLVLDYPRLFGKEDMLAIRVLFWWGNYYSVTLHCRGKYASSVKDLLLKCEYDKELYVTFSGDEWNHDLSEIYVTWDKNRLGEILTRQETSDFIKISLKTPLCQWEEAEERLYNQYQRLLNFVKV